MGLLGDLVGFLALVIYSVANPPPTPTEQNVVRQESA
jgi:hypothetical protein